MATSAQPAQPDPFLAPTEQQSGPPADPFLNPDAKLEDVHPAFAGSGSTTTSPPPPPAPKQTGLVDPSMGAILGGIAGIGVNKALPLQPPTPQPSVATASGNVANQSAVAQQMMSDLVKRQLAHTNQLSGLQQAIQTTQSMHNQNMANFAQASQNAQSMNAVPNLDLNPGELTTGDKWAFGNPEKGTTGVTGDMGPGGKSVTEAARNYKLQQGLSPSEAAKFKVNRSGLIVTNELPVETPLTPAQQAAQEAYKEAHKRMTESEAALKELHDRHSKLVKEGPYTKAHEEAVARQQAKTAGAEAELKTLLESVKPESMLATAGRAMGRVGPMAGGATAGGRLMEAWNELQKRNYGPAAVHTISGLGGLAMMYPNPAVRSLGALAATLPEAGLSAYEASKTTALPSR